MSYELHNGDVMDVMRTLDDESVDCVITSPPYWQLRDYGYPEQWGLEPTFQEYLEHLWLLMDEVKRVLKPTGTAWINLGDTYAGSNGAGFTPTKWKGLYKGESLRKLSGRSDSVSPKSLILIPHRFAIGCIDRGWILRNDIIWAKRNGMPESVTDRFSKKHEYFFLMAKSQKYYFDLDAVRDVPVTQEKRTERIVYASSKGDVTNKTNTFIPPNPLGKNPGTVSDFWDIPTRPSSAKHYATFNTELIDKPIKAGCPEGGVILDPFCGTATTGVRALELGRQFIGIDGSREYIQIAEARIKNALSTDLTVTNNSDNGSEETDCETKADKRHSPQTALPFLNGD